VNFEGQSAADTLNLLGVAFVPPDTNGAVGAKQFCSNGERHDLGVQQVWQPTTRAGAHSHSMD
jgi:hypothetical protein